MRLNTPMFVSLQPVFKWPGGKRKLLPSISRFYPVRFDRYFEPFVGAGAVWLDLHPRRATISDANYEVITTYRVIREEVNALLDTLRIFQYEILHTEDQKAYYYGLRDEYEPRTRVQVAARFLLLNRLGFNGLYRVNKQGDFNVPFGQEQKEAFIPFGKIALLSEYLNSIDLTLRQADYTFIREEAKPGDFVYLDPPYHRVFTQYTPEGFTEQDQAQVAELFAELDERGVFVFLSNSDTPLIRELYSRWRMETLSLNYRIGGKGWSDEEKKASEVLVIGKSLEKHLERQK